MYPIRAGSLIFLLLIYVLSLSQASAMPLQTFKVTTPEVVKVTADSVNTLFSNAITGERLSLSHTIKLHEWPNRIKNKLILKIRTDKTVLYKKLPTQRREPITCRAYLLPPKKGKPTSSNELAFYI